MTSQQYGGTHSEQLLFTQINATSPPSQTKLRFHNYDSLTRIVCILEALQKNICKANVLKNLQPAFTSMFAC